MRWSKEEIEQLVEYRKQGLTARQIAEKLNCSITRIKNKMKNSEISEIDTEKRRLDARLVATENERNTLKAELKYYQSQAALFDSVISEIDKIIVPFEPLPMSLPIDSKKRTHIEDVVMHQSDEHMDEVVKPETVQNLENFNFDVACVRAENYVNKVLEITQKTLTNYRFPNLWILRYGDHSSGEIHDAVSRSNFQNQFRNMFAIAQVHALMVRDLAPYFENVFVVCLPGNHGRRTKRKDYNAPWNSWDYAINQTAALLNQQIPNVKYLIPNAYSTVLNIQGFNFAVEHGDDIKSWNSVPYYGIERKTRRLLALNAVVDRRIDYFVLGHFHQPSALGQLGNTETIINGTWQATNPYIFGSLSGYIEPSQWLHGVHAEHGLTWRFKIKLRSPDELKGPTRYKIELAQ